MEISMADILKSLRAAGAPIDQLNEGQQQVLTSLSTSEVQILIKIHERLSAAEADVKMPS
jgi:hypothetical protein